MRTTLSMPKEPDLEAGNTKIPSVQKETLDAKINKYLEENMKREVTILNGKYTYSLLFKLVGYWGGVQEIQFHRA